MFQNKAVVVTGAGRGIGHVLALGFAAHGANVLVHYAHSREGAQAVAEQIIAQGGHAALAQADLRDPAEVARFVKDAYAALGPIDVWINNAGASANSKETAGMDEIAIFERMVEVDIRGTWLCCRTVERYMRDGGCILTTGWDGALVGAPGLPNQLYAISKGAIMSLTRALAAEFAPRIRVNCIAPETILTDRNMERIPEMQRQALIEAHPIRRLGTPQDIARAALFLASDEAGWITGIVLDVAGGATMV